MSSNVKRVALLARPGAAGQRLAEVLDEAGVELVLQADPTEMDSATVLAARPDTLLVALDAPTEDALDRLEAALHAPAVDVIYEEASLVVAREGWDAARWRRHLLAKLQGHDNVLPPATDSGRVPHGSPASALGEATSEPPAAAFERAASEPAAVGQPATAVASAESAPALEAEPAFPSFSISQTFERVADSVLGTLTTSPATIAPAPPAFSAPPSWTLDPGPGDTPPVEDPGASAVREVTPSPESIAPGLSLSIDEPSSAASIEAAAATPESGIAAFDFSAFDPVAAEISETQPAPTLAERWAEQAFVTEPEATATPAEDRFHSDLASLELRIASMSLAEDTPARGTEQVRGAVLVLAGIGGPDAVRQLLGSLPADFVRPVLVQQRLDGARHDRLVAQMQRATTLPVKLAEAGQTVERGTVYIVPDHVGVQDGGSGLVFQEGANDILAALPAADSAVLLLSGSDPARVDAALNFGWAGGFVVGQNIDGCYDAAAVTDLAARGGTVAKPADMGARLMAHWLRGG